MSDHMLGALLAAQSRSSGMFGSRRSSSSGGSLLVFLVFWTAVAVLSFFFAIGWYIFGRVVLVDMGLNAPDYWAWYWGCFFTLTPGFLATVYVIKD